MTPWKGLTASEVTKLLLAKGVVPDATRGELEDYLDYFAEKKFRAEGKWDIGTAQGEVYDRMRRKARTASNLGDELWSSHKSHYDALTAKDKALKQLAKEKTAKQTFKRAGAHALKGVSKLAAGPVGAAALGLEVADVAIDLGVGGDDASLGRTRFFQGEEAAYNQWAGEREGKTPTYSEYRAYLDSTL